MDVVLISVTLSSLALAGGMSVLVAKMLRDERRRSDARVATLLELAAEAEAPPPIGAAPAATVAPAAARRSAALAGTAARRGSRLDELEIRPAPTRASEIFAQPERSSPWGRRFAVIGVLAAVGAGALLLAGLSRSGRAGDAPGAGTHAGPPPVAPLELVAMRHTQDGDTLTITGLVQNPRTGAPLTRVAVTAVVLGADGTVLASGRAPLDYTALAAGDESPFVVTVQARGAVARYRVGFRSEDGEVLAHVDRRTGDVSRVGM